jgi:hypothetical protein
MLKTALTIAALTLVQAAQLPAAYAGDASNNPQLPRSATAKGPGTPAHTAQPAGKKGASTSEHNRLPPNDPCCAANNGGGGGQAPKSPPPPNLPPPPPPPVAQYRTNPTYPAADPIYGPGGPKYGQPDPRTQ